MHTQVVPELDLCTTRTCLTYRGALSNYNNTAVKSVKHFVVM